MSPVKLGVSAAGLSKLPVAAGVGPLTSVHASVRSGAPGVATLGRTPAVPAVLPVANTGTGVPAVPVYGPLGRASTTLSVAMPAMPSMPSLIMNRTL